VINGKPKVRSGLVGAGELGGGEQGGDEDRCVWEAGVKGMESMPLGVDTEMTCGEWVTGRALRAGHSAWARVLPRRVCSSSCGFRGSFFFSLRFFVAASSAGFLFLH